MELDDAGWINAIIKPVCSAMFGDYQIVQITGNLIITDSSHLKFNLKQWQAYCRIIKISTQGYISSDFQETPYVLDSAISWVKNMVLDLYVFDGQNHFSIWDDEKVQKLKIMVDFVKDIARILASQSNVSECPTKTQKLYEYIRDLILAIFSGTSSVQNPSYLC